MENSDKKDALAKIESEGIERILEEKRLQELLEGKEQIRLQKFQKFVHINPKTHSKLKDYIKQHPIHGNDYLPIGVIEMLLDQLFFGLWGYTVVSEKQVLNEYVVTVTLKFKHPVTGDWIERGGTGATPIQQDKNASVDDLTKKKVRALEKDAPHALTNAKKNAAQTIGRLFGRDLGRDATEQLGEYSPMIDEKREAGINQSLDSIINQAKDGKTKSDK